MVVPVQKGPVLLAVAAGGVLLVTTTVEEVEVQPTELVTVTV
jgi:hypothetical protein